MNSTVFVIVEMKFFQDFVFTLKKFWVDLVFRFNKILQTLCNPWFGEKFQFFFVNFLIDEWASNRLSIFDRYLFIEKFSHSIKFVPSLFD